ncbi:MAG: phospholipase B family protein [Bacteroidetes bacterium]|jgi:hypothetical protein|nr:phospholipase B family protein [Bacteroidota bacterium]
MKPFVSIIRITFLLSSIALFAQSALAQQQAILASADRQILSKASMTEQSGWIELSISGTPRDRGFQHGYLLARQIDDALRARRVIWEHVSAMPWSWLVHQVNERFTPKVDTENRQEIEGIVAGMTAAGQNAMLDEMVAYNMFLELLWYWWPNEQKKVGASAPLPQKQSCSAFIATGSMTADGGIVMGHNTMLEFTMADANVVLTIVPARGNTIVMQTFPGWIHSGTDFFLTSRGLIGAETTIGGFDAFDESGIPEFIRLRRAIQDAASIDEWCEIMKKGNNGGYANSWLIGDINTNEIARLELGLKFVNLERTKDGFYTGSNIATDKRILRFETTRDETDIRLSSVARRERWKQLMKEYRGRITVETAKLFEADHYDAYLRREAPSGRVLCGHFEADTLTFGSYVPFYPEGSFDAKVVDTKFAKEMRFWARWGRACGEPFDAKRFLTEHPQFDWMQGILKSRGSYPWVVVGGKE